MSTFTPINQPATAPAAVETTQPPIDASALWSHVSYEYVLRQDTPQWAIDFQPGMLARLGLKHGEYDVGPRTIEGHSSQPRLCSKTRPSMEYMAYCILARMPGGKATKAVLIQMGREWTGKDKEPSKPSKRSKPSASRAKFSPCNTGTTFTGIEMPGKVSKLIRIATTAEVAAAVAVEKAKAAAAERKAAEEEAARQAAQEQAAQGSSATATPEPALQKPGKRGHDSNMNKSNDKQNISAPSSSKRPRVMSKKTKPEQARPAPAPETPEPSSPLRVDTSPLWEEVLNKKPEEEESVPALPTLAALRVFPALVPEVHLEPSFSNPLGHTVSYDSWKAETDALSHEFVALSREIRDCLFFYINTEKAEQVAAQASETL